MKSELMKAVEFESTMTPGGHIALPPEMVGDIPAGEQIRVVLMWEPSGQESEWQSAGRQRFESAYCAEDEVYEQLLHETSPR